LQKPWHSQTGTVSDSYRDWGAIGGVGGRENLAEGQTMKIRDIIKLIEAEGWYLVETRGSHRQYKHPLISGRVTIAGHPNDDLAPGTLNSVLKQAKLKEVK